MALRLKTEHFQNSEFPKTQTNFTKTQQKFYQNSDFRKLIKSLFKLRYCIIYVNCIFWCNIFSVPKNLNSASIANHNKFCPHFSLFCKVSKNFPKAQKISPKLRKFSSKLSRFSSKLSRFSSKLSKFWAKLRFSETQLITVDGKGAKIQAWVRYYQKEPKIFGPRSLGQIPVDRPSPKVELFRT